MKPREKIQLHGPQKLEDYELIALMLGRGTRKENIFQLSKRILQGFDREELLHEKDYQEFKKRFRLGTVSASQLMAAVEFGRRFFEQVSIKKRITSTEDIYEVTKNMQYLKKEYVRGIYLNTRNQIIHNEIITIGSLDANILHPREIFRPAIEHGAYALIMIHNHPSGDPSPSTADQITTQKIQKASKILKIPLLDHIIIGENSYFSFHRDGNLNHHE
ncbi:MAG TPA: DNA repair protein RadC [Candidatus Gracilibacteria bacterium]|nr:DNA repair protein RadC [Candidatus Gracilibacteria bacterium]